LQGRQPAGGFQVSESTNAQITRDQPARVLIVEDDRDLNNLLKFTLESTRDYEVASHFDGKDAVEMMLNWKPHLVLLDVMLPHTEGTEVLRAMRKHNQLASIPVILLTAKSQESDKIDGFEAGADDYITKPFSPRELLLRVQALMRRSGSLSTKSRTEKMNAEESTLPAEVSRPEQNTQGSSEKNITVGPLSIYPEQFKVLVNGESVALTATEYQLLLYLAERAGRLQSRDALLQRVWGYEGQMNTRTVDTHVKRLRQKLGDAGVLIETVHGFGYQLIDNQRSSKS
jgi:two-component system phosphate regulon response regulator PhoB